MQKAKPSPSSAFQVEKSKKFGPTHSDTRLFDDKELLKDLMNYKLVKIKYWYGYLVPSGVVNGLQLTYKNLETGKLITTDPRYGNHQLYGSDEVTLDEDEYVIKASMRAGQIVDNVTFQTSKGRTIKIGGNGGDSYNFGLSNQAVVGTFGGFGGHLHHFGLYLAPIEDVYYARRRPYILLKHSLMKNEDLLAQMKNDLKENKMKAKDVANVFACIISLGNMIFSQIILYL